MKKFIIRKATFKKWVLEQPDRSILGKTQINNSCPLAMWMLSSNLFANVNVYSSSVDLIYKEDINSNCVFNVNIVPIKDKSLPIWATKFIARIDKAGSIPPDSDITKEDIIKILEKL